MSEATPRDVDAAPIAWREAGTGPAVVFLHGLGMTRTGFDPQLAALADRFRCVAWDMPGYGASPAPDGPLTFPALATAVDGLLDTLGVADAHLVGLSLGGMVALHAALEHPRRVRSLALLDSSPAFGLDGTQPDAWRRARLAPLDEGVTPAAMAERVLRSIMAPGVADDVVAAAAASMARIPPDGLRAAVECLPTHDVRARLGEIRVPALVVVGERDEETPPTYAQALADGIAGAELAVVPGAGHIANLEAPAAVNALLRGHLDAAERAAA
jgi:3-oxoadipate enol-lactonase